MPGGTSATRNSPTRRDGVVMSYQEALDAIAPEVRAKYRGSEPFREQAESCQRALDELSRTLRETKPDITIIIGDDQDEWFYEDNMPALAVYWGDTAPLIPRQVAATSPDREVTEAIRRGYGDVAMDVPVASRFGRFLIESLIERDFDVAHMRYVRQPYGGRVARRYPTRQGELDYVRETPPHEQGLPHAFAFIVKRLFDNHPGAILPVLQNTCYPPNQPTPRRCFALGEAIAAAVAEWRESASVAIIASGGLSHFVVDEELDRSVLEALEQRDAAALRSLPRHRLYSAGLGDPELGRPRRRDAADRLEDGATRLRPRVSDARRDRRRLGLRPLALMRRPGAR